MKREKTLLALSPFHPKSYTLKDFHQNIVNFVHLINIWNLLMSSIILGVSLYVLIHYDM
jgi:hypothetical protein